MICSFIIDDNNEWKFTDPDPNLHGRGLQPRNYEEQPYGSVAGIGTYDGPIKDKKECQEIAAERQAKGQTNRAVAELFKLPIYDQNGTNYCWMNATIKILMYLMAKSGQPITQLSAASCAAPIKNFKNQGGWGGEAVDFLLNGDEHHNPGGVPVSAWPNNAIDRSLDNPSTNAMRVGFAGIEIVEIEQGNLDQLRTLLVDGWLVAAGLAWWSHEILITDYDPLDLYPFDNSWGISFGDKGRGSLTPKKAVGDYVAFRTMVAA